MEGKEHAAPCGTGRELRTDEGSAVLRKHSGPVAEELYLLCRPAPAAGGGEAQAEAAYRTLLAALEAEGLAPESLVSETVFFRSVGEDLDAVRAARHRVLGEAAGAFEGPAATFIGQAPLGDGAGVVEIAATAMSPHRTAAPARAVYTRALSCACRACQPGIRGERVRVGEDSHFRAANIHGSGQGVYEQARDMFRAAEALLGEAGMTFRDVVRTWIYLRDIDRDYDALNRARREFFDDAGIETKPASTGVQGAPYPPEHDVALGLYAIRSPRSLAIATMSSSTLNEAWTYGADFSRGLVVVDANKRALYVSGTASIGESGETVAVGDFDAQADRMLRNIEALLAGQGAGFADLVSAVAYLKNAGDGPRLREIFHSRGFAGFPRALVEAPLCRPELLCETEVVAIVREGPA